MRVDFVGHATLLARQGRLSILSDPWWTGPAYRGQWYPYPFPVPERYDLTSLDAVYVSHLHEDHLHRGTLLELLETVPDTLAIIPLRYDTTLRDYLKRIGFRHVREVRSGTSFTLHRAGEEARLTLFTNLDDSLLAVEAGGEVMINTNDALHSAPREVIEEYCRIIRGRFPRVDYLFCGFGGASYFPNCLRVPGKDDVAVARAREELFLQNFALIADLLSPRFALPFAAHFVLPDERNWWISTTRLGMEPPASIARSYVRAPAIQVVDLQPGDYVEQGVVHASPYPGQREPEAVHTDVLEHYPGPHRTGSLTAEGFSDLLGDVRQRLAEAAPRLTSGERIDATLVLWDYPGEALHVVVADGQAEVTAVRSTDQPDADADVVVETRSDLVRSTMDTPFGRDLICVGYAGLVRFKSRDVMRRSPHEQLLNLLAPPQPRWRQRLQQHPARTLAFILGDPGIRQQMLRKLGGRVARRPRAAEPSLYDLGDWTDPSRAAE